LNYTKARLFHELRQGYELLLDPLRRMALDAKLRLAAAKKERYKAYDVKRKAMVADLEEREAAFKRTRADKDREERARWTENERIKEEGRKMREEKQKRMEEAEEARKPKAEMRADTPGEAEPPELGKCFHESRCLNISYVLQGLLIRPYGSNTPSQPIRP
jgi:DnaJ homolog subfamily C member 17